MVRLVEVVLKPGKRACPPLATPAAGPAAWDARPTPATQGWGCRGNYTTAGDASHKPEIFHSDQGCQFTSGDFVARLQAEEIKISWSGRKRCYDNILVERLWRTVKYEEVYLHAYSDG
ncbi:hypothetical protein [Cyanobium sp. BA20m-p-22]|uniref:hypothetical protein n=1 Tax=Cyanobium sp. BA20m-p-22 TaxID=2823704 RepID=UPI0037C1A017